jgi:hypothetical protein
MLLLRCLHLQPFELQRWMHPTCIRLEDILPPAAPPPASSFGKAKTSKKNGVQVTNTMANWFCHCLASKFFRMLPPMLESGIRLKDQDDEVDLRGFAFTFINANASAPLPSFRFSRVL